MYGGRTLDELDALAADATPGPWTKTGAVTVSRPASPAFNIPRSESYAQDQRDAVFIAASRAAVPDLVARIRALENRLAWIGHRVLLGEETT